MTIYRILTDLEVNGNVRKMERGMTPATCRFYTEMREGRSASAKLPQYWQDVVKKLNSKKAYQYATGTRGGWVNTPKWPVVQLLGFENEFFEGEAVNSKWVMVYTNILGERQLRPNTVQKWWNIKRNGHMMPGKTFKDQSRIILISKTGIMYVPAYRVVAVE